MKEKHIVIDSVETFEAALAQLRDAQKKFATFTQEQVDKIFLAAATAANQARIPLAKLAVEETGYGVVEDKVIKNHYAAEYQQAEFHRIFLSHSEYSARYFPAMPFHEKSFASSNAPTRAAHPA